MTFAIVAFALLQAQVPTADDLFAYHLNAAGGRPAFEKAVTAVRKGCFEPNAGGRCMPAEIYAKAPGKWQFRMWVPGVVIFEQGSDGVKGWSHDPEESGDLTAKDRREQDYAFNFDLPLRADHLFTDMKVTGKRVLEGRDFWAVEGKIRDSGEPITMYFDAATGLLARVGNVAFDDYRPAGDIKVPFTVRIIGERVTQVLKTSEVAVNTPVEDFRFDRAGSAAAFKRDMDAMWLPQLEAGLKGIDPGQARPMFEKLRNFAPEDGRMLYDLIVKHGYKRAIEIGTARGNSALWIGIAMKRTGGKLITIEMNSELAKIANENFAKAGLAGVVECRNNDAFKEIPAIPGEFDLVFMDTGTRLHKKFLDLVRGRIAPGGAVVSHNANDFERAQPDFLKAITEDPKLETKVLKTAGGGLSFSVLR